MSDTLAASLIHLPWPAPRGVHAVSTTRLGGISAPPWDALNLGDHVGDDPAAVLENRARLQAALGLSAAPRWLQQVHGTAVVVAEQHPAGAVLQADAAVSFSPQQACVVMTADCLPVLFCSEDGAVVAAAHAGWRGLLAGVLERTIAAMARPPEQLMAWLGPAISRQAFEVGDELRQAFVQRHASHAAAFTPGRTGHCWADLPALARQALQRAGVSQIYGGDLCTHADRQRFFSYRRDGQCGRMASLIWRQ